MPRRTLKEREEWAGKRAQIIAVYTADGDWRAIATELSVPQPTAYRWIAEGIKPDSRGGRRHFKVLDEHRNYMIELIEDNPKITLQEIVDCLNQTFELRVSKQSVARNLDALTYTLKSAQIEPERINALENKEMRKIFVENLLAFQSSNYPVLYMDESNFNIHISRAENRSLRGTRCSTVAAGSKRSNVHVLGCISDFGIIHYEVHRGPFSKEDAMEWMRTCLREAMLKHGCPVVMVVDNIPSHSGIEEVFHEEEFKKNKFLRLSPYSSMLNPIENIWSAVKSHVKSALSPKLKIIDSQVTGLGIREHRIKALEELIVDAMDSITPSSCADCIENIRGKVDKALNMYDLYV